MQYSYDSQRRLAKTELDGSWTKYSYDENGRVSEISKNNSAGDTAALSYKMTYDHFGRQTAWKIKALSGSERTLESYYYNNRDLLSEITYGNGDRITYGFNSDDQLTSVYSDEAADSEFFYDDLGRHTRTNDRLNSIDTYYSYNSAGEMVSQSQYKRVQDPNNSWIYTAQPWLHSSVQRDKDGKTIAFCHDINNLGTYKTSLRYGAGDDEDKSYVYGVALNGSERLEYGYNPLGQRTRRTLKLGGGIIRNTTYEFLKNTRTDDLSPFVKTLTNQGGQKYSYTYNSSGYITKVQSTPASGEGDTETTEYFYDAKGQLIRCNDSIAGTNEYYAYDKGGNILSRTVYPYGTTSGNAVTTSYTYDNEDKLISFNGQSITYDEMGNPMQYRDSMSMSWSAGRQLSYMYKGNDCLMFDYNADGIRTKKLVGSNTTEYLISDGVLTALKFDENTGIYFMRDESGVPYGFTYTYDGIYALTDYYYQYNLQGDVVAILDSSGNIVAKYDYDAWGKLISMTDGSGNDISNEYNHIGRLNPLRYRGYIYDEETGFYYLGSRYYDPVTGRFINADSQINDGSHILGTNLYAYCYNNPVNYADIDGRDGGIAILLEFGKILVGVVIIAGVAISLDDNLRDAFEGMVTDVESVIQVKTAKKSIPDDLSDIASKYGQYQCANAQNALKKYLDKKGEKYSLIKLEFPYRGFVMCYERCGDIPISLNGNHYGLLYNNKVYCNIFPEGREMWSWINSFEDRSGQPPRIYTTNPFAL